MGSALGLWESNYWPDWCTLSYCAPLKSMPPLPLTEKQFVYICKPFLTGLWRFKAMIRHYCWWWFTGRAGEILTLRAAINNPTEQSSHAYGQHPLAHCWCDLHTRQIYLSSSFHLLITLLRIHLKDGAEMYIYATQAACAAVCFMHDPNLIFHELGAHWDHSGPRTHSHMHLVLWQILLDSHAVHRIRCKVESVTG